MFIEENSTVDVVLLYKRVGMHYLVFGEKNFNDSNFTDEEKEKCKKLTVKMKQLTWGLHNEIQEGSVDTEMDDNGGQQRVFNHKKYKELRLTKLIHSWDAKTEDDSKAKVSERAIKSLAPEVAESILNLYDEVMYMSEEDEKK